MRLRNASIQRRLMLAPLAENRARAALSVLAIALGVALGYAVQLINQAAVKEFSQAVKVLSGQADLEIHGPRGGFAEALYPVVAQMPEVALASPMLEIEVRVTGRRDSLKLVGVDVFRAARIQPDLVLAESADDSAEPSAGPLDYLRDDRVFLSPAAADSFGVGAGDVLGVQVGLDEVRLSVAGILRGAGLKERLGVIDLGGAQWRLDRLGVLNRIDVRLRPGVDEGAFAERLRSSLPAGVVVERPEAGIERSASLSRAYRVNLNVLALVALFTGGLLVFSTQALAVVQRRAQLALLRVLGVTRRRLVAMLLGEAFVIGAVGALAGIVLGHLGAELVIRHFGADLGAGQFGGLRPELHVDAAGLAFFAVLGIATAVLGALASALEAARAPPAQALKAGDEQRVFERLRPVWPGIAMLAAGAALTQAPAVRDLPLFGYAAIACFLVGAIILMPRLAVASFGILPSTRAVAPRLALAQLAGAPGQATVSLAAIVASVSLMVSMAIMVTSFRQSLEAWLDRLLPADVYLRTGPRNEAAYLSPEVQQRIRAIPGVKRVDFLRIQQLLISAGRPSVMLFARDIERSDPEKSLPLVGPFIVPGPQDPAPVWVSEALVDLYGYRTGAVVALPLAGHGVEFTVAGVWRDYARQQGTLVIERSVYLRLTGDGNANDAALWLHAGADAESVTQSIRGTVADDSSLWMAAPDEIRELSLRTFDRTFAVTYALEAVAVLIGLFGLSSSFGALVLARKREFGMLRHIGMTRRQIGAMLASEGALISALGLATGLALGWLISLVLIHVVNRQSFHWSMELALPWRSLAVFCAVMLALAVLTALLSGRRAMSDDAVRAVKEDW